MPKSTHEKKHHHSKDESQEGFISNNLRKSMNKNEKIIMGVLIGGIVTFLVLSIIVLFGKGGRVSEQSPTTTSSTTPTVKVITTPYPTVPPITDFFMQVNEKRFYPDAVGIRKGHKVTILNIAQAGITVNPTVKGENAYDFGRIESGEEKVVNFDKAGVYRYTRSGAPDQTLTITVTE